VLGLLFQFGDKAGTNTIETGEEAAPEVLVAPEIFASLRVENGEIGIASGRSFVVIGDGVFGDVPLVVDGAGLSAREQDAAAFVRVGGEKEDEVGVFGVRDNFELAPFSELVEGMVADGIGSGLVDEADEFGVEDAGRLGELLLRKRGGIEEDESEEKGERTHRHLREREERVLLNSDGWQNAGIRLGGKRIVSCRF
jgi:hypothetical protein